jgi:hypothetical protein
VSLTRDDKNYIQEREEKEEERKEGKALAGKLSSH